MIYKKTGVVFLLFSLMALRLFSQEFTDNRRVTKSYKINASTTIEVDNKYGKVQVMKWEHDSVLFDVRVKIVSENSDEGKNLLKNINIDFTATSFYISANTKVGKARKGLLSDLKLLAESIISSESQVQIDYTVKIPSYANLKIINKYGDVYIDDIKGNFDLKLSNGDLRANRITGNCDMELKFCGNANINHLTLGRINASYSELHVKYANQISLSSKSSKLNLEEANIVKLQSRSDKVFINKTAHLYGDTYFTDVSIAKIMKEVSLNMKYGILNLESILCSFAFINLYSKFTDINLFFQNSSAYHLDITHKQNTLNYPSEIANLETKVIDKEEDKMLTTGKIGSKNTNSKVKIDAEKSVINIFHK